VASSLFECPACGKEVSSDARACIHCGHPLKKRHYVGSAVIAIFLIATVLLMWRPDVFDVRSLSDLISIFQAPAGLPSCDSAYGQSRAKDAMDTSPLAKTLSITIISMSDPETISASSNRVECKATVILNNSTKGILDYSFAKDSSLENGKYLIRAFIEPDSLRPYQ